MNSFFKIISVVLSLVFFVGCSVSGSGKSATTSGNNVNTSPTTLNLTDIKTSAPASLSIQLKQSISGK